MSKISLLSIATTPASSTGVTATESTCLCSWYSSVATKICINTDRVISHLVCFLSSSFTVTALRHGWKLLLIHITGTQPCVSSLPCASSQDRAHTVQVSFCNSATLQTCTKVNEALSSFARAWTEPLGLVLWKLWSSEFYTELLSLDGKAARSGTLLKNGNQLFSFVQLLLCVACWVKNVDFTCYGKETSYIP